MSENIFSQFYNDIDLCLKCFATSKHLPQLKAINSMVNQENGTKSRGDFSLNFVSPENKLWHDFLQEVGEWILNDSKTWSSFSVIEYKIIAKIKLIQLFIDRKSSAYKIITCFSIQENYFNCIEDKKSLIICESGDAQNQFWCQRTQLMAKSLANFRKCLRKEVDDVLVSHEELENFLKLASNSPYAQLDACKEVTLDTNKFFSEHKNMRFLYESKPVDVNDKNKEVFCLALKMYKLMSTWMKDGFNEVFVVTRECRAYKYQVAFLTLCMVYRISPRFILIPVANVVHEEDLHQFLDTINKQIASQCNDSGPQNEDTTKELVETVCVFALLSSPSSCFISNLKSNTRESTFIQYNCSRLSSLIRRYHHEYNKLINNKENIDISLLVHDLEWVLLFYHIPKYHQLIQSMNENITKLVSFDVHQLVLFLRKFVTDVSVYYQKVHILTVPSDHLLTIIYTRVYFIKLLLNIFTHSLNILGLKVIESM